MSKQSVNQSINHISHSEGSITERENTYLPTYLPSNAPIIHTYIHTYKQTKTPTYLPLPPSHRPSFFCPLYYIISYYIISYHTISYHTISCMQYHTTSYQAQTPTTNIALFLTYLPTSCIFKGMYMYTYIESKKKKISLPSPLPSSPFLSSIASRTHIYTYTCIIKL